MGQSIHDLPPLERPREKAFRYGIESLSDAELLSLIISCGYKGTNAKDIAYKILSENKGLYRSSLLPFREFSRYLGIGKTKALLIGAVFEIARRVKMGEIEQLEECVSTDYLYEKYAYNLMNSNQEQFLIVCIDSKHKVISETVLYKGTSTSIPFSLVDLSSILITHRAKYFYILHNHPSGDYSPSDEDVITTTRIIEESKRLKCRLLDHIIIGNAGYFSFKHHSEHIKL